MEDFIKSQIEKMKGIKADSAYFERSFQKISSTPQSSALTAVFRSKLGYSLASVGLALVFVFFSFSLVGGPGGTQTQPVASLSNDVLESEVNDVDFEIHVAEASYFNNSAAKVASVLDEIVSE